MSSTLEFILVAVEFKLSIKLVILCLFQKTFDFTARFCTIFFVEFCIVSMVLL